MIMPIPILIAIFLLGLGCGAAIWFVFRHKQQAKSKKPAKETATMQTLPFRWSYIMLPLVFLFLSILLSAYFYYLLPTEVAYHFKLDGTPDKWMSREGIIIWVLIPQLLLTLMAGAVTWGVTKLGKLFGQTEGTWIKPERIVSLMGNMVVLPQLIVFFAMLDIFSYNSYQIHLMPMWIVLLIILGLATIALMVFLAFIVSKARQHPWRTDSD
ncbi:hypothetical protein ES703_114484 [subsurface metagenome]